MIIMAIEVLKWKARVFQGRKKMKIEKGMMRIEKGMMMI